MESVAKNRTEAVKTALLLGARTGRELENALGVSGPTLSRIMRDEVPAEIRTFGSHKSTIYGYERKIFELDATLPLFRISPEGDAEKIGSLTSIYDRRFIFESTSGKLREFEGLPYFFEDARPQGYLGRAFSARHPDLRLPLRIVDWSGDQTAYALFRRGEDTPGNLIAGNESYSRWVEDGKKTHVVPASDRMRLYESLADAASAGNFAGSSAGGEQPKFTCSITDGKVYEEEHRIIKFSPRRDASPVNVWADLLYAEGMALEILRDAGHSAAVGGVIEGKERVFLETARFDRIGRRGRVGVVSFGALIHEFVGSSLHWARGADDLFRLRWIDEETRKKIIFFDAFGALIANTDRHFGNLSFFSEFNESGRKSIKTAPIYDMLPMAFAPSTSGEDPYLRPWKMPEAIAEWVEVFPEARRFALEYWQKLEADRRISEAFRLRIGKILANS